MSKEKNAEGVIERGFFWTPEYQKAAEDYVQESIGRQEIAIDSPVLFHAQDIQNLLSPPALPFENKSALDL